MDLNGNGRRDYHEPVLVHNNLERFEDVGADGCSDADEDGLGGCGGGGKGEDPNGDNHGVPSNAAGTEGDGWRQEGESWSDTGIVGPTEGLGVSLEVNGMTCHVPLVILQVHHEDAGIAARLIGHEPATFHV